MTALFTADDLIASYSRADALADGTLVAASSNLAADAGIKFPVAYTRAVHTDCIAWDDDHPVLQDETGREWDVLWMFSVAVRRAKAAGGLIGDRIPFGLYRVPPTAKSPQPRLVSLVAVIGPGDTPAPVITIMEPGES